MGRIGLGLALAGMLLTACGPVFENVPDAEPIDGLPSGPSALANISAEGFPPPLIAPDDVVSVLPADAIPAIDQPQFVTVAEAGEYLDDREPVVVVDIDGDARAYPVGILMFHEIVNDTVGDVPVSITYCPLCNSAVTYDRRIRGNETTFGVSGRLFNSALVMYDRATQTLWTHFDGRAVIGLLAGAELEAIPSPLLSYGDFRAAHPDGRVLDKDRTGSSGRARHYFLNPYEGYDAEGSRIYFPVAGDERLDRKERVVALTVDGEAAAWQLELIAGGEAQVTAGLVADRDVVIFWKSGQASALETSETAGGRDVGSTGVFLPEVEGRSLSFAAVGGEFVDHQTGSTWDITGRAVAGELAGAELEQIPHLDTFWFAWSSYRPDSTLHAAEGP